VRNFFDGYVNGERKKVIERIIDVKTIFNHRTNGDQMIKPGHVNGSFSRNILTGIAHNLEEGTIDLDGIMRLLDERSRNNINWKGDDKRNDHFHDAEVVTFNKFNGVF
jgi:hypothetical protein